MSNESKAINALKRFGKLRASDVGWEVWGDATESPKRGLGSHRHNKFCRAAGKLLRRLERDGKVKKEWSKTCLYWKLA